MYVCMNVCMYVSMYVSMYLCMYIRMYVFYLMETEESEDSIRKGLTIVISSHNFLPLRSILAFNF